MAQELREKPEIQAKKIRYQQILELLRELEKEFPKAFPEDLERMQRARREKKLKLVH